MKLVSIARACALGLFALVVSGCVSQPKHALDPAERTLVGGREALVSVKQGELRANIDPAVAGAAFGLIGALVDVSINQSRADSAEQIIKPVRDALIGYDFDRQALDASKATLQQLQWLGVERVTFSKEFSKDKINAMLDGSQAPEDIFIDYDYALTADFSSMQVSISVIILSKAAPNASSPDSRQKLSNAAYFQGITCLIPLAHSVDDKAANARTWADNGGKLARQAIDLGLAQVNVLAQRALNQTPQQAAGLDKGETVTIGKRSGKLIEKTDAGTLLLGLGDVWVYQVAVPLE